MNYRELSPRSQGFLFNNIEDWVSEDNPVRLIDLLIDKLYQSDPESSNPTNQRAMIPEVVKLILLTCLLNSIFTAI
ncbi:MAG: hypothetical protein ACLVEJ_31865 [Parabacteroides sp.]